MTVESMKTETTLFFQMLRIRMVEEAIAAEYRKQQMRCPTHLCIGQEAIAVGVCAHLQSQDIVFSTHRSHGHYLAKGGNLPSMIAELYGKATGCAGGIGGSQHLVDLSVNFWGAAPIVASTIPVAVGASFSVAQKKEHRIVVCFFGEAATEEGVFFESVNFAALKKLPILFVCENNLYSTNTPLSERQAKRSNAAIARAMGIEAYQKDGNNIRTVYAVAHKAIEGIRKGRGAQFIEFATYRHREHCGPNEDPSGYRPEEEQAYWRAKDPLRQISKNDLTRMKKSIQQEIDAAFAFASSSPFPAIRAHDERLIYK